MSRPLAKAAVLAPLLMLLTTLLEIAIASTPCNPLLSNCLPSCKTSCRTARCLYNCHYDTTLEILKLAITPPEGPSLDAFNSAVAKLTGLLEDDVQVRIDPLGVYRGKMEVADYIATFLHPLGLSTRSRISGVQLTHFVNTGNVSACTFNLVYYLAEDPTQRLTNLTGTMFNFFNNASQKISKGDWNYLRIPQMQEELLKPLPRVSDAMSTSIIRAVCGINEQVCRPQGYSGYDNVTDCMAFMSSIPRIALYGIQGNNQYCRFLHTAYATIDPRVHCPHIGRSGGGMCVEKAYTEYYTVFPAGTFIGNP